MFEDSIRQWISSYLSETTSKTNNIARCPFAKPALDKNSVIFRYAKKADDVWNVIEKYQDDWDEETLQAVVIHLDWDINNSERIRICDQANRFYGTQCQKLFVEEFRILNNVGYHFILMHDFIEMQNAKRLLKKQGYYTNNG